MRLNRNRSKSWILAEYMNTVYYGNHAYGIEAAAQTYFSRPARKLTLIQSALLAGLPQAPSVYDPFEYPARAIQRRNGVLNALYESGAITLADYKAASAVKDLKLKRGRIYTRIREPYFFSYVREELIKEYGAETVRSGGLRVYTTDRTGATSARRRRRFETRSTTTTTRPRRSSRSTRAPARSAR